MSDNAETITEETTQEGTPQAEEKQPDAQELLNEIARLKRTKDKLMSESAEWRKKYQSTLSEQEKASQEKADREAEREEQFKALVRENQINKIEKSYMKQGWTADEASRMAIAEADGDFEMRMKILSEVDARKAKSVRDEFIKSRPELQYGTGASGVSKEQFDKMNLAERTKLFRENPDEYKRLTK